MEIASPSVGKIRHIHLLGANGNLGQYLLPALISLGYQVIPYGRGTSLFPNTLTGDILQDLDWDRFHRAYNMSIPKPPDAIINLIALTNIQ